ncbi:GTP-binding protein rbg1 [Cryptotrichosporon argae]
MDVVHDRTAARMGMLACAILCGLASGSNYVYSGYAPQLAASLHLSSTQANIIGTAGNLGMYLSGPLWGRIVDARGPRIPLLCGFALNLTGYTLLRALLRHSLPFASSSILLPCLAMFFTGVGGSAGSSSSVNAAAKSFPDHARASATGAVLAGFGLSAFAFSVTAQSIFGGDAAGLLLLLSLGTSLPLLVGSFVVRPVPPPPPRHRRASDRATSALARSVSPRTSLDVDAVLQLSRSRSPAVHPHADADDIDVDVDDAAAPLIERPGARKREASVPPVVSLAPRELLRTTDFYLLFATLAILCGVGLEWINNVGAVTLALARDGWSYDPRAVSALQARQVATVSALNASGRIVAGVASDFCKTKFGVKRVWFLPAVAFMFLLSQLFALDTTHVSSLWRVSAALGLSYGSLFNVVPMLVLEWFGMAHFSQNYGWTCVAPVIGGNIFNLVFGRVFDAHSVVHDGTGGEGAEAGATDAAGIAENVGRALHALAAGVGVVVRGGGIPSAHECLVGRTCYATALELSAAACVVALGLSVLVGFRRERAAWPKRSASV